MGDYAQLITAIAALITATGGAVTGISLALASLRKQRGAAAEEAVRLAKQIERSAAETAALSAATNIEARLTRLEHLESEHEVGHDDVPQ